MSQAQGEQVSGNLEPKEKDKKSRTNGLIEKLYRDADSYDLAGQMRRKGSDVRRKGDDDE
jgi:hypothetical protein